MFKNTVQIIGTGPGNRDYLLPIAKKAIEEADCLMGARRVLSQFNYPKKEKVYFEGHIDKITPFIKNNLGEKKIAVLVSGDAGLYSFLGKISRAFKKKDYAVISGISSLQLAFAKIGESWEDAKIISLHGRKPQNLIEEAKNSRKMFLFLDAKFPPQKVARYLLDKGIKNKQAFVFENLSYPNERIIATDLKNLSKMDGFALCVMIIKK
ncbi:MAG: precorrin-6y C5,15-methyltransferase (decarboxylating) subunit CbiE [Candidatus Omnitrophota bacterium]|jgi:cobalt-precorrin-7 (C5)-methyltransferase